MSNPQAPVVGNAAAGLGDLLAGLGIKDAATRAQLDDLIADELTRRGLTATVAGIRYNVATLLTDPHNAALLAYDIDSIRAQVNARTPHPLEAIVVKTRSHTTRSARS